MTNKSIRKRREYNTNLLYWRRDTHTSTHSQSNSENCLCNIYNSHIITSSRKIIEGKSFIIAYYRAVYWDIFPFIALYFNRTIYFASIGLIRFVCIFHIFCVLYYWNTRSRNRKCINRQFSWLVFFYLLLGLSKDLNFLHGWIFAKSLFVLLL